MSSNSLTRRLFWLAGSLVLAVGFVGIRPARARLVPMAAVPHNAKYTPGTFHSLRPAMIGSNRLLSSPQGLQ